MKVHWHYVDVPPEPTQEFPPPAAVDVRRTGNDIYRVLSGRVTDGLEEHDVSHEVVKIVDDTRTEPWVYTCVDVVVRLTGGYAEAIKPGTKLAVLPPNYQELLRDARRRTGPEEPARAGGEEPG